MAYTYSGDPANSSRDWVRFKVGDTDMDDGQLQDEEIDALVTEKAHKALAAASCAEALSNKYALIAMRSNDQSCAEAAIGYQKLADRIRSEAAREGSAVPSLPSRSIDDKDATLDDTDRVRGRFFRDQHKVQAGSDLSGDGNLT